MKWLTRSHVHVDRVACPWLIRRFVDSAAEFLFVPKGEIDRVARAEGAIPFDAPGADLRHHDDRCSFDAIIQKYGLTDPALLRLAKIVNAADTDRLGDDPLAAGLEAIATGYALRFPDDRENLERQFEVYDALYAWCRLQGLSVTLDGRSGTLSRVLERLTRFPGWSRGPTVAQGKGKGLAQAG